MYFTIDVHVVHRAFLRSLRSCVTRTLGFRDRTLDGWAGDRLLGAVGDVQSKYPPLHSTPLHGFAATGWWDPQRLAPASLEPILDQPSPIPRDGPKLTRRVMGVRGGPPRIWFLSPAGSASHGIPSPWHLSAFLTSTRASIYVSTLRNLKWRQASHRNLRFLALVPPRVLCSAFCAPRSVLLRNRVCDLGNLSRCGSLEGVGGAPS